MATCVAFNSRREGEGATRGRAASSGAPPTGARFDAACPYKFVTSPGRTSQSWPSPPPATRSTSYPGGTPRRTSTRFGPSCERRRRRTWRRSPCCGPTTTTPSSPMPAWRAPWPLTSPTSSAAPSRSPHGHCLLYYKGFLACQAHRAAHRLWASGRRVLALFLQSRVSEVFAVDIHPGARIGKGILLDHATGLVVGETAVIGDEVSILHNIGDGVLVGAGTQILGNVRIGAGAKIGAGSVVIKEVPPMTTAVGNPSKLIGGKKNPLMLDKIPGLTMDHTSWSDYVI
ncbi:unnamed protein product [Spirodela intermedia]|uniref:serine O-acetyltransferase n=1 Tax=Spirodela intermedia TaxID=51605 RepID=A0A7I8IHF1_SPIIN|nr:unnamed protein product [Spirodela intermedia]CAA6657301.1 unnamed protein product [Spirodela intermedia]